MEFFLAAILFIKILKIDDIAGGLSLSLLIIGVFIFGLSLLWKIRIKDDNKQYAILYYN